MYIWYIWNSPLVIKSRAVRVLIKRENQGENVPHYLTHQRGFPIFFGSLSRVHLCCCITCGAYTKVIFKVQ